MTVICFGECEPVKHECVDHSTAYTQMVQPPWMDEGYTLYAHPGDHYAEAPCYDKGYESLWEISECAEVSLKEEVANFYLLEAIASQVANPIPGKPIFRVDAPWDILVELQEENFPFNATGVNGVSIQAMIQYHKLCERLAPVFRNYSHYAIAGELTYHEKVAKYLSDSPSCVITSWYHMVDVFGEAKCLGWAEKLFRDGHRRGDGSWSSAWNSSFGGERWANAVDNLAWYVAGECEGQPFGAREFLDRVFNLQHNTGSFLNKVCWAGCGTSDLPYVLDAHNNSDWQLLSQYCSDPVRDLFLKYWGAANEAGAQGCSVNAFTKKPKASKTINNGYSDQYGDVVVFNDTNYCTGSECTCSYPKVTKLWDGYYHRNIYEPLGVTIPPKLKLSEPKNMKSKYPGVCKTSGKPVKVGSFVVHHGKGKGVSLQLEWVNEVYKRKELF